MAMYRNTSASTLVLGRGKSVGPAGSRHASFAADLVNLSDEDLGVKGVKALVDSKMLILVGDMTKEEAQAPAPKVEAPAPKVEAPAPKSETPPAPPAPAAEVPLTTEDAGEMAGFPDRKKKQK